MMAEMNTSRANGTMRNRRVDTKLFRDRMRDLGITNRGLAKALNLDPSATSLMLRGKRGVKDGDLSRLAKTLTLGVDEVLRALGQQPPSETVPLAGTIDANGRASVRETKELAPRWDGSVVEAYRISAAGHYANGWTLGVAAPTADFLGRPGLVEIEGEPKLRTGIVTRGFEASTFEILPLLDCGAVLSRVKILSARPIRWIRPV